MSSPKLLYVDLFCGAGGTTTGIEAARYKGRKCAKVLACVNHDATAIASHRANHPHAMHFIEDVRTLNLAPVVKLIDAAKGFMPDAKVVLWASLECTNFSKAKGGLPRDPDSRTLAEHLYRYIEELKPDYVQIENVEEFMSWGDLDENGKPVSRDRGKSYVKWCNKIQRYGYIYDYRLLTAADFGAYTSRRRYFGQFAKKGLPLLWPEADHGKVRKPKKGQPELFDIQLKPWKPVRDVLDLDDEGPSIFDRKKPLVDATLVRIYDGLIRYVAGGQDAFLVKYNSMNRYHKYVAPSLDEPSPSVTVQQRLGVVKTHFISKCFSGSPAGKNISVDGPAGAITTIDHHAFISAHYRRGYNRSVKEPCGTITTRDKFELVTPHFIDMQYGAGVAASIDNPAWAVTGNPKHRLVTCKQYLINPQFQSGGRSVDDSCFTLIARMDKRPPYLVTPRTEWDGEVLPSFMRLDDRGRFIYEIYSTDCPILVRIKEFMAMYYMTNIMMRMLNVQELKRITGFSEDYILMGTVAQQKKGIGNAVPPILPQRMAETIYSGVYHQNYAYAI